MNTQRKRILSVLILLLCCAVFMIFRYAGGKNGAEGRYSRTGFAFDTVIDVTLYDTGDLSEEKANELLDECMQICTHYEDLFSRTKEGSDIFRIAHAGGNDVNVDPETARLLSDALSFAEESNGLADPSIGALSSLWFPDGPAGEVPSEELIKEAIRHIDHRKIIVNGNTVRCEDPGIIPDLGFIAKGYAADRLGHYLSENGVESALINLGGNVLAIGKRPDGSEFRVGVRDPLHPDGSPILSVPADNLSVVSSGNYERFFEKDGVRYHHILDPETGYPADTGLSQVTIISSSSEEADALSTICFLLGYDRAVTFLKENHPDVRAFFVDASGNIKEYKP